MKTCKILATHLAAIAMALLAPAAARAQVTWGLPTTIAGDTDVSTAGVAVFAYSFGSAATVNGVSFTAVSSATSANNLTMSGFSNHNGTAFTTGTAPFGSLSAAYKNILVGANYSTTIGAAATITLTGLSMGHNYAIQYWGSDPRAGNYRTNILSSVGGNTVGCVEDVTEVVGGLGQYSIGTFTAVATSQSFTINAFNSSGPQLNALLLRDTSTLPVFSLAAGTYVGAQSLTITGAVGSTVFYTTDGTTPTASSPSGPSPLTLSVASSMTVSAYYTNAASPDSLVNSATYVILTSASGLWTNLAGGSWVAPGNWSNNVIAYGTNSTADFSALTLTANTAVALDGAKPVGNLNFGDVGNTYSWTLNTGTGGPLTLVGTNPPAITVNNQTAILNAVLAGTNGLTLNGPGTLSLRAANTYTGSTVINGGVLQLVSAGVSQDYTGGNVYINNAGTLQVNQNRYNFANISFLFDTNGGGTFVANASGFGGFVFMADNSFVTLGGAQNIMSGTGGLNLNSSGRAVLDVTRGTSSTSDLSVATVLGNGGGVTKKGNGIASFDALMTYSGATVVSNGTLLIGSSGSIQNGGVTVAGGRLQVDGTIGTGAVLVQSNGTLAGHGTVGGPVTIQTGATLMTDPATISTLTLNGSLALSGKVTARVNSDTFACDAYFGMAGVTYGGTLTLTNLGSTPLADGQSFTLFTKSSGAYGGSFATVNLPPLTGTLSWDLSQLTQNGSIRVVNAAAAPVFTPPGGGYVVGQPLTVTISSTTPGAAIHYTTDFWLTTNLYTGPLTVPVNTNIAFKAYASKAGYMDSSPTSATYDTEDRAVWLNAGPFAGSWSTASNWTNNIVPNNSGATVDFNTLTLTGDASLTLDGAWTVGSLVFGDVGAAFNWDISDFGSGSLTLNNGTNKPVINVVNQTVTISAPIGGANGLTKTGNGLLMLAAANSYSGGTTISRGALEVTNYYAAGTDPVTLGDANTGTNDVQLILDIQTSYNAGIPNDIIVSTNGTGAATVSFTHAGGWYNYSHWTLNRPATINATNATSFANLVYPVTGNVGTLTVNGAASGFGLCFNNPANSFTGSIVLSSGNMGSYPGGLGAVNPLIMNGGVYYLLDATTPGIATTIGSLNGTGTIEVGYQNGAAANQIISVGNDNGTGTFVGAIVDGGGTMSFVKTGTGVQTLAGTNTYTGTTTVSNGTLRVDGSLTNSSFVTVTANGTLAGIGNVQGPVWLYGTMAPGANAVGTLTTGPAYLYGGSTLTFKVASADTNNAAGRDFVNIDGTLYLDGLTNGVATIKLVSMQNTNTPGNASDFSAASNYTWTVGTATSLSIGNNLDFASHLALDTTAFSNPHGGTFALQFDVANNALKINYTGAPAVNTNPTSLAVSVGGGNLNLSWPADHLGWRLEVQSNPRSIGLSNDWVTVTGSTNVTSMSIPINPANPTVFYRLVYP
jgi:autotransporter-associated beta strand protein